MKSVVISRAAYLAAHGTPARSGGSLDPEIVLLWNKVQKLQMATSGNGGGEYIIVEPEKDEDLRRLRTRVYGGIRTYVRRLQPPTFAVRILLRRDESHVLVWREPLVAQRNAKPLEHEQLETTARPRLAVPRDGREKVRSASDLERSPVRATTVATQLPAVSIPT